MCYFVRMFRERLRHPIDTFRTAPVGFTLAFLGVLLGGESIREIVHKPRYLAKARAIGQLSVNALALGTGASMVSHQFKLRHRLERAIDRHGFDPRYMAKTLGTFCDRQTAKVVSEKAGFAGEYQALVNAAQTLHERGLPLSVHSAQAAELHPVKADTMVNIVRAE